MTPPLPAPLSTSQAERRKRAAWHDENVRRRHNYLPFMFSLLRLAAERGQLAPLVEAARQPKTEKQEQGRK